MSIRIASRLRAVSTSVSPFVTLDPDAATFTVSAERRFSANSNEMRVRVDASKNRLTIVAPRSVGTFLIARSLISLNGSAVSRINWICSPLSGSSPSRSLPSESVTPCPRVAAMTTPFLPSSSCDEHVHALRRSDGDLLADDVRLDRQLASAAVDQNGQARFALAGRSRPARRAPRESCGRCRARRRRSRRACRRCPPGICGLPDDRPRPDRLEVVAVERDVERALRRRRPSRARRSWIRFAPRAGRRGAECRR